MANKSRRNFPSLKRRGYENCAEYSAFPHRPDRSRRLAIFLPQFFGSFPFSSPGGALFERFNIGYGPRRVLQQE